MEQNELLNKARRMYAEEMATVMAGRKNVLMDGLEKLFGADKLMPRPIKTWSDLVQLNIANWEPIYALGVHEKNLVRGVKSAVAWLKIVQLLPFYQHTLGEYEWNDDINKDKHSIVYNPVKHIYEIIPASEDSFNVLTFRNKELATSFLQNNVDLLDTYLDVDSYEEKY